MSEKSMGPMYQKRTTELVELAFLMFDSKWSRMMVSAIHSNVDQKIAAWAEEEKSKKRKSMIKELAWNTFDTAYAMRQEQYHDQERNKTVYVRYNR
jgi:hypothetical protein